jgi:trimeric autotransporter adhesin
MLNTTVIPAPRVPLVDPETGIISTEWYRYLFNLFTLTGAGGNAVSLDDLQIGPPVQDSTGGGGGGGSVNSVTGTAPIASTGGVNPDISISQATTSTNGYLSSTDWNTFNSKGSGTVTSVTGTSPVASSGGNTPAISISQATTSTDGYLSSTDWNTFNGKGSGTVTSVDLTASTGISVSGGPITGSGSITVTNTAPDQTVAIASGTGISVTGTYPSFTVTNTAPSSGGTVTSVTGTSPVASSGGTTPAISLTSGYGDTQNPYASKTANFVLAAPNGTAGVPTFRAVVAADIPTLNQNTTGTASNVTGTVAIANGGTGQTTRQAAIDALAGSTTLGSYLRGDGTDVVMSAIQAADVPTLNQNTTGSAATLTTGRTIAITGDLAYTSPSFNGSTNVTAAGTLATVNANVGSFTNASLTVNAKGLITAASSGAAPVTSVTGTSPVVSSGGATPAISLAASYGDTQNPYASKTANFILAAPNGSAGVPTFRAVVAADIPTLNQNTTGTASNVTGTVAIANGGTGQTTATNAFNALSPLTTLGDILYEETGSVAARLPIGTTSQVLTVVSGKPAWAAAAGGGSNITALGMWENNRTISANYTVGTGNSSMSSGPITINSGVVVTVPSGSRWVVL